jgi:peptidyl-tRNA hydrolase
MTDRLIQYIVIRKDLVGKNWPLGAIVAQGCHAATAAIAKTSARLETIQYLQDYENMTKCVLGAENIEAISKLSETLTSQGVLHHLWIEQPENIAVSLATAPEMKSKVSPFMKHFKLLK